MDIYEDELYHHGILGMKWGVRRYQNEDGSYTEAGKKRYGNMSKEEAQADMDKRAKRIDTAVKILTAVGISAAVAGVSYAAVKSLSTKTGNAMAESLVNETAGKILDTNGNIARAANSETAEKISGEMSDRISKIQMTDDEEVDLWNNIAKRTAKMDRQTERELKNDRSYQKRVKEIDDAAAAANEVFKRWNSGNTDDLSGLHTQAENRMRTSLNSDYSKKASENLRKINEAAKKPNGIEDAKNASNIADKLTKKLMDRTESYNRDQEYIRQQMKRSGLTKEQIAEQNRKLRQKTADAMARDRLNRNSGHTIHLGGITQEFMDKMRDRDLGSDRNG